MDSSSTFLAVWHYEAVAVLPWCAGPTLAAHPLARAAGAAAGA